jgi:hypothetical protein
MQLAPFWQTVGGGVGGGGEGTVVLRAPTVARLYVWPAVAQSACEIPTAPYTVTPSDSTQTAKAVARFVSSVSAASVVIEGSSAVETAPLASTHVGITAADQVFPELIVTQASSVAAVVPAPVGSWHTSRHVFPVA